MEKAELIIDSGTLCTMNAKREIKHSTAIVINQGQIVDIVDSSTVREKYSCPTFIDGSNCIVMPGLVNTHTHSPLSFLRGISDDLPLMDWLQKCVWPIEKEFVTAPFVKAGTQLAICEMLLSGTTTFNDSFFYSREVASTAKEMGMRCVTGNAILDFPTPSHKTADEALAYVEENLQENDENSLITHSLAPHSLYTCFEKTIGKIFDLAAQYNAMVHIHLSESTTEVENIKKQYGITPVGLLQKWGNLGPHVVAAHCVHLTDADMELLADSKVGIAHNPESNLKLGNGVAPISHLLKKGATIGLGTDGAASNNDLSLLGEVDFAAKLQKGFYRDPTLMNSLEAVEMITLNGAKTLRLDHKIGSIEVGKQADIILIHLKAPHLIPLYNPYSHIVYSAHSADIKTVIVQGRVLVQDRKFVNFDPEKIYQVAHDYQKKVSGYFLKLGAP